MTPHQLATEIRNSFDYRDRPAMELALMRLVALAESHKIISQAILRAPHPKPEPIDPSDDGDAP